MDYTCTVLQLDLFILRVTYLVSSSLIRDDYKCYTDCHLEHY